MARERSDGVYRSLAKSNGLTLAHLGAHLRREFIKAERDFPAQSTVAVDLIRDLYEAKREMKTTLRRDGSMSYNLVDSIDSSRVAVNPGALARLVTALCCVEGRRPNLCGLPRVR